MIAIALAATAALAQGQVPVPPLPPTPVPAAAPTYGPGPAPLSPGGATLGTPVLPAPVPIQPPVPAPIPYPPAAPPPGPPPLFAAPDPGRDGWGPFGLPSALPTLFFGADLYFLHPSIKGTLRGNMPQPDGSTITFTTPGAGLDMAVSPQFEAGWRLPDSAGEFGLTYRFIATAGNGQATDAFGPLDTRTRLNMNIFDFDYESAPYAPWPRYYLKWRLGIRLETIFYDNQASNRADFSEKASNYFVGAGPHAGVEFGREINPIPGLAVFTRLDGAAAFGRAQQHFSETFGDTVFPFSQDRTQSSGNLTVQAGVSYSPPSMRYLRLVTGFQYERFWDVGKVGGSTGDVQDIGGFFGASFDY